LDYGLQIFEKMMKIFGISLESVWEIFGRYLEVFGDILKAIGGRFGESYPFQRYARHLQEHPRAVFAGP